jgi:hypothetical protein
LDVSASTEEVIFYQSGVMLLCYAEKCNMQDWSKYQDLVSIVMFKIILRENYYKSIKCHFKLTKFWRVGTCYSFGATTCFTVEDLKRITAAV